MTHDRFADAAAGIGADERPAIPPSHGLQVHHAAKRALVLEMNEPGFPAWRVDPCPLMRAVDSGAALIQNHPAFVGAVDRARSQHQLPALFDTAGWSENVVVILRPVE